MGMGGLALRCGRGRFGPRFKATLRRGNAVNLATAEANGVAHFTASEWLAL